MKTQQGLAVLMLSAASVAAQAAYFNPDNGHYYELYSFTDTWRLDWNQAEYFAESKGGYLATLTGANEDDFVWNLGVGGYFLGAYDASVFANGVWRHNAWSWVTGEAFSYSNWLFGEPNHWQDGSDLTPNNEDYLMYWWAPTAGVTRWNDTNVDSSMYDANSDTIKYSTRGFVVEYDRTPSPASLLQLAASVPVPSTLMLLTLGLTVFVGSKRRRS